MSLDIYTHHRGLAVNTAEVLVLELWFVLCLGELHKGLEKTVTSLEEPVKLLFLPSYKSQGHEKSGRLSGPSLSLSNRKGRWAKLNAPGLLLQPPISDLPGGKGLPKDRTRPSYTTHFIFPPRSFLAEAPWQASWIH